LQRDSGRVLFPALVLIDNRHRPPTPNLCIAQLRRAGSDGSKSPPDVCLLAGSNPAPRQLPCVNFSPDIRLYLVPTRPASNVRKCSLLLRYATPVSVAMCQVFGRFSSVYLQKNPRPPASILAGNSQYICELNPRPPPSYLTVYLRIFPAVISKKEPCHLQSNRVQYCLFTLHVPAQTAFYARSIYKLYRGRLSQKKRRNTDIFCVTSHALHL
jgi:hypothetical protein